MPLFLFALPVVSTLLGGLLAIKLRRHFFLLIAAGAGLLLGAAFLDLLPEAIVLGLSSGITATNVLAMMLLSFLVFYALETGVDHVAKRWKVAGAERRVIGRAGAVMLIFHSFRDGLAIGAAFAASHPAGYAVACGIAAHDLGDGMNTVILSTSGERAATTDYLFLVADAAAPLCGALLTYWWTFSQRSSVVLLVVAAGFFLQMATSDFLPEIRRSDGPRRYLLPSVLAGVLLIYAANLIIAR